MILPDICFIFKVNFPSVKDLQSTALFDEVDIKKEWINWIDGYKYYLEYKNAEKEHHPFDPAALLLQQQEQLATI